MRSKLDLGRERRAPGCCSNIYRKNYSISNSVAEGTKRIGRPRMGWIDAVKESIGARDNISKDAREMIRDLVQGRRLVSVV